MKIVSFVFAAALLLSPGAAMAGEQERDTQDLGNRPAEKAPPADVPEAAIIGGGVVVLALIGGAAAGLGSGGGNTPPTSTTSTTP